MQSSVTMLLTATSLCVADVFKETYMRKMFGILLVALLFSTMAVSGVFAQEALTFGEWVEGALSNSEYEVEYTFDGAAGDLVLIQMIQKPGTYELDPSLVLMDSGGDRVAINEDFLYSGAVIVTELPADGTYTLLATRYEGSTGSSEGDYWLRADIVEPLTAGSSVEATLDSNFETAVPTLFVLTPDSDTTVRLGFSQELGELFAGFRLVEWGDDVLYGTPLLDVADTARLTSASFTLELEGGKTYILIVDKSFSSFVFEETTATVNFTVE
jgi:hypothetical protein